MDVAEHFDCHCSTVSAWRNGRNDVSRHVINELCDWLNLPADERLLALQLPFQATVSIAA